MSGKHTPKSTERENKVRSDHRNRNYRAGSSLTRAASLIAGIPQHLGHCLTQEVQVDKVSSVQKLNNSQGPALPWNSATDVWSLCLAKLEPMPNLGHGASDKGMGHGPPAQFVS